MQPDFIIRVHGTGAGRPEDEGILWWQIGSDFQQDLEVQLGSRATCFPKVYHWSGKNSERERRIAGRILYEDWLLPLEHHQCSYHLIGHSHGGSVVWSALCESMRRNRPLQSLKSWTTVGTPFLHYGTDPTDRWLGTLAITTSTLLVIAYVLFPDSGLDSETARVVMAVLAFPLLGLVIPFGLLRGIVASVASIRLGRYHRLSGRAFAEYGGRWLPIHSGVDEAIHGLRGTPVLQGEITMPSALSCPP